MSVLVKGISMPETCEECTYQTKGACFASGVNKGIITIRRMDKDRPDWCPLLELPERHGRLVDFDKIEWYEVTGTATVGDRDFGETKFALINIDHFRNLPTVIKAEGE